MAHGADENRSHGKPEASGLITAARSGCTQSLGELAGRYRRYLLLVANQSLSPALRVKVAASDLVQETLLHFQQQFGKFEGTSEDELLTWLRRILYFRALQVARRYGGTASRDVRRELSLSETNDSLDQMAVPDSAPTPCTEFLAREQLARLDAAIAGLSVENRQVIMLRNVDRLGFSEMGQLLDCTAEAARKRWVRAIAQLRAKMISDE
ncbi:MAG: sigma-70 family RNA polymerase sigma factor [Pirellulales bacterium]